MQYWYHKKAEEAEKRYLEITFERRSVIIDLEKVVYVEKRRNQCVFHCTDGSRSVTIRSRIFTNVWIMMSLCRSIRVLLQIIIMSKKY